MLSLAVFLMLLQPGIGIEQQSTLASGVDTPKQLPQIKSDLGTALGQLAKTYRFPIVIVLADSHRMVEIPARTMTPRQALNHLVAQDRNYSWEPRGPGVYFCHRQLCDNPKNMLNWRLKTFTISGTLADLEMRLRANLNKIRQGITAEGGVMHGIPSSDLAKRALPRMVLHDITVAEVLFKILEIEPSFYSVMVYPKTDSIADTDIESVFANWRWVPLTEEE